MGHKQPWICHLAEVSCTTQHSSLAKLYVASVQIIGHASSCNALQQYTGLTITKPPFVSGAATQGCVLNKSGIPPHCIAPDLYLALLLQVNLAEAHH